MKTSALVFIHEPHEGAALFEMILKKRDFDVRTVLVSDTDLKNIDTDVDVMLIMGGSMGVYESYKYPFLYKEIDIIRRRLADQKPILGICLGSQLMAAACGARVYKGIQGQEIGWHNIEINAAGKKTPVKHLEGMMFHWHGDTFDLPTGATILASSQKYAHQAFSYGQHALGLQCHPEVMEHQLESWYTALPDEEAEQVRADTKKYIAQLNKKAAHFFEDWLESIYQ